MKPLAVYIHVPFCEQRCGYCDFVSGCDLTKIDAYLERLVAEIKAFDFTKYTVQSIYLGGGTPSLLSPVQIKKIFTVLPPSAGEVTIEVNPNSLTVDKCVAYRAVGINRISIGVQSFDDATLRDLGRRHDVKQAVAAIYLAAEHFANVSIDLIKDIPGHRFVTPPATVLDKIKHLSIYSLTRNDHCVLETDEPVRLPRAFHRYEVSNYARQGYESRHNLAYWSGGEYIGFGCAAHSLLNGDRFANTNDLLNYHRYTTAVLTPAMVREEQIMLGLRLATGVSLGLLSGRENTVKTLQDHGLVKIKDDHLIATTKGLKILNQLWLQLVWFLAGAVGIGPTPQVLETHVLPLNYAPKI